MSLTSEVWIAIYPLGNDPNYTSEQMAMPARAVEYEIIPIDKLIKRARA